MKTPRIDHAARSRRRMEETLSSHETGEDAGAIVVALAALNDAVLALVEQQRISNLVALASTEGKIHLSNMSTVNQLFDAGSEGLIAPNGLINPDIAAALGIEVAS